MDEISRRRCLRRSLAVGAAAVAGCIGDGASGTEPNPTTTPTDTPVSGDTPGDGTESPTPTGEPATPDPEAVSWDADVGSAVETTPVVGDSAVYTGTVGGAVVRHALEDGTEEWVFEAEAPIQELAVAGDAVLAVVGTVELSADQTLHALDAATGEQRWTLSPGNWWLELLATRDGVVYVATADDALGPTGQQLFAVPVGDGEPVWSAEVGDPREAVLTDDGVFVSSTGRLYAFDRADGTKRWHTEMPDPVYTTLAAVDGTVVQGFEPENADVFGLLAGFDPESGEERWRLDDPGFVTEEGVDERHVYAGSEVVRAVDSESGETTWTWSPEPTQGGVQAAGITDGRLYLDAYHDAEPRNQYKFAVGTNAGDGVRAFEDGTQLTDLAVGGGVAVTGGANGRLYALQ